VLIACYVRVLPIAVAAPEEFNGQCVETGYQIEDTSESVLEASLKLKARTGAELAVVTLAPKDAALEFTRALCSGADSAWQYPCDGLPAISDEAALCARMMKELHADVLMVPSHSELLGYSSLAPLVYAHTGIPFADRVRTLSATENGFDAVCESFAGGIDHQSMDRPCVISWSGRLDLRYGTLDRRIRYSKDSIINITESGMTHVQRPSFRVGRSADPAGATPEDAASAILSILIERGVVQV
jgi:electron transfer flavoprotein alpha/beta subunit